MDGSDALSDSVVSVFILGSDSRIFLSELTDEKMVKTSSDSFNTLNLLEEKNILKNKFILKRINLDNAHFKKFICISRKC